MLAQEGLVDRDRLKTVQGSFLDDGVYQSQGTNFESFQKIFAYLTKGNLANLVAKFEEQSPKGTQLFILTPVDWEVPNLNPLYHRVSGTIKSDFHFSFTDLQNKFL